MRTQIESLLLSEVSLPGQYIGGELGSIVKPKDSVRERLCFAFPDVYTIGMSNYGLQLHQQMATMEVSDLKGQNHGTDLRKHYIVEFI